MLGPDAREKANKSISAALTGRVLSESHKAAIGAGVKRAGCKPPRNTHLVGKAHPNYVDGSSIEQKKKYLTPEYKAFVRECLIRDKFTCQKCGEVSRKGNRVVLQVHHIKPWAGNPELRYVVSNGITLCKACHYRTSHRRVSSDKT
jgi:hypothetical protein